ncbi:MAG: BON domain-containing protein [Ktedonobacterales bacterium]|nr:BON domain-containing protein [Ktedonobacterales bacterium]
MQYTRLELRFLPRGWVRGVLYTGAVGGKVRGAVINPGARVVTHTLLPRSRRNVSEAEASRRMGTEKTPLPAGDIRLTASARVCAGTSVVGRVTCLWTDRTTSALTHVLVRPRGRLFFSKQERILPLELVETMADGAFTLAKGAPPLLDLPPFREDDAIERDVRLALAEELPDLQARRTVKVRVEDGHVSLVGAVEIPEIIEAARRAVARVPGVRGVTLDVISLETLGDRVEEQIRRVIAERHITGARVRVLTEHAIVYLEGTAPSVEARAAIERAALAAAGARVVVNDIAVGGEPPSRATQTGPLVRNR